MTRHGINRPAQEWPGSASAVPPSVTLPVCPVCGNVGKNPGGSQATYACVGPPGEIHKRTRMVEVAYEPYVIYGE